MIIPDSLHPVLVVLQSAPELNGLPFSGFIYMFFFGMNIMKITPKGLKTMFCLLP